MKLWIVPVTLVVFLAVAVPIAVASRVRAPGGGGEQEKAAAEYVPGLKRAPGTWEADTIAVRSGTLGKPDVIVDITAQRTTFVPWEIKVKKGQVVQLRITGKDNGLADMPGVDEAVGLTEFSGHGFQILGPYDVYITGIRKGVTKEVAFKATTAGEFPIECTVFCAPTHYLMQAKLIVEE